MPAAPAGVTYTKQGSTQHFTVYYDNSLGTNGAWLADMVFSTCEADYNRLQGWFGNLSIRNLPFNVYIHSCGIGAVHSTCSDTTMYCDAFSGTDADLARSLVVAEADEVFMANQAAGWDCSASNGEALSRVLAAEIYPDAQTPPGLGVTFSTANSWLNSTNRPDFVNVSDPTDKKSVSIGCGALFINWLRFQLGSSLDQIVQAGGATLSETYRRLNYLGDSFGRFSILLDINFPAGTPVALPNDNPFPLPGAQAVAGALSGYEWSADDSRQVVYLNPANQLQELFVKPEGTGRTRI